MLEDLSVATGLVSPRLKSEASNKETGTMKRVWEAQSVIPAAINQVGKKKNAGTQDRNHLLGGGLPHLLGTGSHKTDGDHTLRLGGHPKVQDGDLIPERKLEGQGAHQNPETKRKKTTKETFQTTTRKLQRSQTVQKCKPREPPPKSRRGTRSPTSPGLRKENLLAHHPLGA